MPLLVISVAGLIVMLASTLSDSRRKRHKLGKRRRWWISSAIGWSGVLYAAYVSIALLRFFPMERILLSLFLGAALGGAFLYWTRVRAKSSQGEQAGMSQGS